VNFGGHKPVHFDDPKNGGHFGRHNFEHFGGAGRGNFGGAWQSQRGRPTAGFPRTHLQHGDNPHRDVAEFGAGGAGGQYAVSAGRDAAYRGLGFEHGLKLGNPVYGNPGAGGYQVQENVADFNGIVPTAVRPPRPPAATAQVFRVDHHYPAPVSDMGGGDTLDGMSSVFAIASPPTVNNVYFTLDPVVPYGEVPMRPQRGTLRRRHTERIIISERL